MGVLYEKMCWQEQHTKKVMHPGKSLHDMIEVCFFLQSEGRAACQHSVLASCAALYKQTRRISCCQACNLLVAFSLQCHVHQALVLILLVQALGGFVGDHGTS